MPAVTFAAPILPGREEGWRRFVQEVSEVQRGEYEGCRRRLGVRNESVWLTRAEGGETALVYLEADDPELLISTLAASAESFEVWLKARFVEFHGDNLARMPRRSAAELIFSYEETSDEGPIPRGSEQALRAAYDGYGLSTGAGEWVLGGTDAGGRDAPRREESGA